MAELVQQSLPTQDMDIESESINRDPPIAMESESFTATVIESESLRSQVTENIYHNINEITRLHDKSPAVAQKIKELYAKPMPGRIRKRKIDQVLRDGNVDVRPAPAVGNIYQILVARPPPQRRPGSLSRSSSILNLKSFSQESSSSIERIFDAQANKDVQKKPRSVPRVQSDKTKRAVHSPTLPSIVRSLSPPQDILLHNSLDGLNSSLSPSSSGRSLFTDDSNGHSNMAAPRRIHEQVTPVVPVEKMRMGG